MGLQTNTDINELSVYHILCIFIFYVCFNFAQSKKMEQGVNWIKKTTLLKDLLTLFKILEIIHKVSSTFVFEFYSYLLSPHYIKDDRLITGFTTRCPTNLQIGFSKDLNLFYETHSVYTYISFSIHIYLSISQ